MSFLARLAHRATVGASPAMLVPKQRTVRAPVVRRVEAEPEEVTEEPAGEEAQRSPLPHLARAAEPAEEEAQLAREVEEAEEPEAQRMSDEAPTEEATEEAQPQRLARQSAEPEQEASEEGSEEMMASRQTAAHQIAARQTAARQTEPGQASEEEEEDTLQAARSQTSEEMSPENATPPDDTASEPEPSDLRAARSNATTPTALGAGTLAESAPGALTEASSAATSDAIRPPDVESAASWEPAEPVAPPPFFEPQGFTHRPSMETSSSQRPQIQIDQLDVLIHEPTPAVAPSRDSGALTRRAVRARYLRRL